MDTRQVRCGDVLIGGGAPVSVQSMTNADPRVERAVKEQIAVLKDAGCQIVRMAVPDMESAQVLGAGKKKLPAFPLLRTYTLITGLHLQL